MEKIKEAKDILKTLGLPVSQQNELAALTLLALCNVKPEQEWKNSKKTSLGLTKGIISFVNEFYNKSYAPNTRETFRKDILHYFIQARIVDYNPDQPDLPVNSPKAHYALTDHALTAIQTYGTKGWETAANKFTSEVGHLADSYAKSREMTMIPVKLPDGRTFKLSAGKHNLLQAAIIEEFAPRFVKAPVVLYLGDTANKSLHSETDAMKQLGIPITEHSKLPDVVIYDEAKNWLFLIEAVTSRGPVSSNRLIQLESFLKDCKAGRVYVTAFLDFAEFKKHSANIAWETEVWIAEMKTHMIHFNGDRFMGPRD